MRYLPIRLAIPLIIVTPLIASVGVIGFLAFRNGQQAVEDLTLQLSSKLSTSIEQNVQKYLDTPNLLLKANVATIESGNLDVNNFQELQRYFWNQMRQQEEVNTIFFGSKQGKFLQIDRRGRDEIVVKIKDSASSERKAYNLDSKGDRTNFIGSSPYDPRTRPWYKAAKEAGQPTWSPVYRFASRPALGITPVIPIYDKKTNEFQGAIAADLTLSEISQFLTSLKISPTGEAFIIERSGELIANSTDEPTFITTSKELKRLNVAQSRNPLLKATSEYLLTKFNNFNEIKSAQQHIFFIKGKRQFVQVTPLQNVKGLNWLIVVVIPEADFMERIYNQTRFTILIGVGITLLSITLGLVTAGWITKPIQRLSKTAKDIESQKFDPNSLDEVVSRGDEIGDLGRVVQLMASVVYNREQNLQQIVQNLRQENDQVKQVAGLREKDSRVGRLEHLLKDVKRTRTLAGYQKYNLSELLRKVIYFENFSDSEVQKLIEIGYKKTLSEGEVIFKEDEPGDAFYITLVGEVEIYVEKINKHLRVLSAGSFFGELSLLLGIPRTASVRTLKETILFVIDRQGLQKLLRENQELSEQIASKLTEYKAELEDRKDLLRKYGLLDDEEGFSQNTKAWIRNRMSTLFGI